MRTFDNEWIVRAFEDHPSFVTKRMFGGLAVYLFGRQMIVLVEPTRTGRWKWHGVLISECAEYFSRSSVMRRRRTTRPDTVLRGELAPAQ